MNTNNAVITGTAHHVHDRQRRRKFAQRSTREQERIAEVVGVHCHTLPSQKAAGHELAFVCGLLPARNAPRGAIQIQQLKIGGLVRAGAFPAAVTKWPSKTMATSTSRGRSRPAFGARPARHRVEELMPTG